MIISRTTSRSRLVSYVLSLIALILFAWYLINNRERYIELIDLSPLLLLGLSALALGSAVANGVINQLLFYALDIRIGFVEAVELAFATTLANQLPFSGGIIAKGVYLKQLYNLSYTRYMSATVALFIFFLVISGVVGIIVTFFTAMQVTSPTRAAPLLAGFSVMLFPAVLLLLSPVSKRFPARVQPYVQEMYKGWQVLRRSCTISAFIGSVYMIATVLIAIRFWVAFQALSQDVTLFECLLFSMGTILTQLVSITPGGLGVREGIVAVMSALLGFEPGAAVVAVALDRIVSTTVIICFGVFATYRLSNRAQKSMQE